MDCLKASDLIMSCLDGMLSKEEEEFLEKHLAGCPACARQLELQKRIARTLRQYGNEEMQAPPDLCSLVMSEVRGRRRGILHRLASVSLRQAVAVAASVLMIAGGLAGTNAGLKIFNNAGVIGYNTTDTDPGSTSSAPAGSMTGITSPVTPAGGNISEQGPGGNTTEAGLKTGGDILTDNGSGGIAPNTAASPSPGKTVTGEQVLLSSEMKTYSTVLKLKVDYLDGARNKVIKLANGAGTAAQIFPEQNSEQNILFIKITVAADKSDALIAELAALGTVIDRQDDSRDITYIYNETLVQYNDLQYRISTETNALTKQQLEAQAASYKQQLDTWAEEANKRVLSLWLES